MLRLNLGERWDYVKQHPKKEEINRIRDDIIQRLDQEYSFGNLYLIARAVDKEQPVRKSHKNTLKLGNYRIRWGFSDCAIAEYGFEGTLPNIYDYNLEDLPAAKKKAQEAEVEFLEDVLSTGVRVLTRTTTEGYDVTNHTRESIKLFLKKYPNMFSCTEHVSKSTRGEGYKMVTFFICATHNQYCGQTSA